MKTTTPHTFGSSLRLTLCIAALVFLAIGASTTPSGFVFVACLACFGTAFAAASRLNQSTSVLMFAIAVGGLFATCYFVWCTWVISSSPDYWPRSLPYPDAIIDWMHTRLKSRFDSPFGNKRLLLVFGGMASLSAGFTGWVTACLLPLKSTKLTVPLDGRATPLYLRCLFGCAAGFFLGFFPAIILGKTGTPSPLPFLILAASTVLGGYLVSRKRTKPSEISPPEHESSEI